MGLIDELDKLHEERKPNEWIAKFFEYEEACKEDMINFNETSHMSFIDNYNRQFLDQIHLRSLAFRMKSEVSRLKEASSF
jgi:hypothetical protein